MTTHDLLRLYLYHTLQEIVPYAFEYEYGA